jgi:hypothetical protein
MTRRRFGITASLIAAVSVACLAACARLVVGVRAAAEQKRLVQEIRSHGGKVRYAYEYIRSVPQPSPLLVSIFGLDFCADVTEVGFPKGTATDALVRATSRLRSLESLIVLDSPVTDAGLESVASLRKLASLTLCGTEVGDAGIKWLRGLTRLRFLDLDRTKVTDSGLAELHELGELHCLLVRRTRVTEDGLANLRSLPLLDVVNVSVGGDRGLDVSRLQRALPRCLICGEDDMGRTAYYPGEAWARKRDCAKKLGKGGQRT